VIFYQLQTNNPVFQNHVEITKELYELITSGIGDDLARFAQLVYMVNPIKIDGVTVDATDLQFGAMEFKDADTEQRANVELDDNKGALFVQSVSLAKESGGNLAAILAKLSSDPATQTTLALLLASINLIKDTDGIKKILDTVNVQIKGSDIAIGGNAEQTPDAVAATKIIQNGGIARSTVPTEVASGDAVAMWYDLYGRQVIYGANLSTQSIDVSVINDPLLSRLGPITMLNAATATGASTEVDVSNYKNVCIHIISSSVTSGATITVEHSLDGTNYATLSTTIVSANGTIQVDITEQAMKFIRTTITARTDGTFTTLLFAGN
jgi:hypothetical protein